MAEKKQKKRSEIKSERILEIQEEIEKKYGKGSIMGALDKPTFHDYIPTGCIALDKAIGIGGLPKGRIIEVFGPESSGKTTLALETLAQAHKNQSSYCAFVDAEHALDTEYAKNLGVDLNRLKISQPNCGEEALDIAEMLIESGDFDVIVVDSVAALVPKAELEGEMGDNKMGLHSRLMSQAMRKLVGMVSRSNTILIFINQMRDKIGVMFGSPETTTGGNALKYYASVRIDIRRQFAKTNGAIMEGEEMTGNQVTMKVIKNKVAPPFKKAVVDVLYGEGFDSYGEVLDMAIESKLIEKSGTWFSYEGNSIGQGKDNVRQFLKDNEEFFLELKNKVVNSFIPQELTIKEKVEVEENL